jgi:hypothetical protein
MNESTLDAVIQRLTRLERENRWWKMLGSIAIALLGLVVVLGAAGSKHTDEIRAKRFTLIDGNGARRAILGIETKEENPKAVGSTALLFFKDDDPQLQLRLTPDGQPAVAVLSEKGATGLGPGLLLMHGQVGANETISLLFHDGPLLSMETYEEGSLDLSVKNTPSLSLKDRHLTRATFSLTADGSPALAFFDKDGNPYATVDKSSAEPLQTAVPRLYSECLQRKQANPSVDCSEYHKAMELLLRAVRR